MRLSKTKNISYTLIGLIFTVVMFSCGQKNKEKQTVPENKNTVTIKGNIPGINGKKTIALTEINENTENTKIDTIATVSLDNGKFLFENLNIDDSRAALLTFGDTINTVVFLEPGNINVEVFPKDTIYTEYFTGIEVRAKRTGTINNELFTQYRDKRHAVLKSQEYLKVRALDKTMFDLYADLDTLNNQIQRFDKELFKRDSILTKHKNDFILQHKNEMVSPYIVLFEDLRFDDVFTPKQIIDIFDSYNNTLKDNRYYKSIENYVTQSRNTAVGITLADFTLKNRDDKPVSLSSFKGKYVLIDFWAYWCKPCVAAFPHLEKLRKKYKTDGFEILGISSDPNHEKWIKALDTHKPSWTQVIDDDKKTISKKFNIAKLPTTFLIDNEGKIMAIDLYDEDLDYTLKTIFGH